MLRVKMPAPADAPMPPEAPPTEAPPDAIPPAPPLPDAPPVAPMGTGDGGDPTAGHVSPAIACYMGPEDGPFQCGRCVHFIESGECEIVSGPIDPGGCCNLFETGGANPNGDTIAGEATDVAPEAPEAAGPVQPDDAGL